jgi:hypothetical protein
MVQDVCRTTRPPLIEVDADQKGGQSHRTACLFPDRVPQLPDAMQTVFEPGAGDEAVAIAP